MSPDPRGRGSRVRPPRGPGRFGPAVLDAIFPGLGHLAAGRRRRAAMFALPVVAILVSRPGHRRDDERAAPRGDIVRPRRHLGSARDPGRAPRLAPPRRRVERVGSASPAARPARGAADRRDPSRRRDRAAGLRRLCHRGGKGDRRRDLHRAVADGTGRAARERRSPTRVSWRPPSRARAPRPARRRPPTPTVPRVNVLLVGVDAGVGRNTYLTDTMIVASLDPVAETVSMVSVPRDMVDVPLPDGRKFTGKINGLVSYARHHPKQFPGSDGTGFDVLRGALGQLLSLDIPYHAAVNLGGFVRVIDTHRRHQRLRRPRLLRPVLRRIRLHPRVRDHEGTSPPQRPAGARVRASEEARRRERLHPGRSTAGGPGRHPRPDRPRRVHQRPHRPDEGSVEDDHDQRAAQGPPGSR